MLNKKCRVVCGMEEWLTEGKQNVDVRGLVKCQYPLRANEIPGTITTSGENLQSVNVIGRHFCVPMCVRLCVF